MEENTRTLLKLIGCKPLIVCPQEVPLDSVLETPIIRHRLPARHSYSYQFASSKVKREVALTVHLNHPLYDITCLQCLQSQDQALRSPHCRMDWSRSRSVYVEACQQMCFLLRAWSWWLLVDAYSFAFSSCEKPCLCP